MSLHRSPAPGPKDSASGDERVSVGTFRIASSICEVHLGFYHTALVSQALVLHE